MRGELAGSSHETNEKTADILSRLVAELGVTPMDHLEQLAALWPVDDDPHALMKFVLSERRAHS